MWGCHACGALNHDGRHTCWSCETGHLHIPLPKDVRASSDMLGLVLLAGVMALVWFVIGFVVGAVTV